MSERNRHPPLHLQDNEQHYNDRQQAGAPHHIDNNSQHEAEEEQTALSLAHTSPKAGYLTTAQHKRRFFVIDSATHLYYFLSPHDTEPRGCLSLEGDACRIEPHPDDPCALIVSCPPAEPVVLEARSSADAWEWIRVLREERVSAKNEALRKAALQRSGWKSRVGELEKEVENLKLVEKDRDGALEDAANWKRQMEELDEAIRDLTLRLARQDGDDDDGEIHLAMDTASVPGCHFSALHNSVAQLQQNLVLATEESASAIQDIGAANEKAIAAEHRLEQAEKHLCKIWEENCALRKLLKQTRREKRVLVKEVKSLHEQQVEPEDLNEEEEDKLIEDIEQHIQTSILLHEDLLTNSGIKRKQPVRTVEDDSFDLDISKGGEDVQRELTDPIVGKENPEANSSPESNLPVASLFDVDESDEDSESGEEASLAERPNPVLQLGGSADMPLAVSSTHSSVASTSYPTSRLSCPLADVVSSKEPTPETDVDNQVYHLTFYSRKIGLQFQKAPPPPAKAKGLLTEALTSDLTHVPSAGEKTAAELRRIANISTSAKKSKYQTTCDVAVPLDAVLVCGFLGFDDSAGNIRPKLGARLVAFDGVSIEVGRWTFDAVRKSIQARDRPLTLSFRNDHLTLVQREILTKAVKDVERRAPPPHRTVEYRSSSEPSSVHSVMTQRSSEPDDVSVASTLPARSASSVSHNFRSFSDAGSSSSVLSAVGPLVSNLLKKKKPFTPSYLKRPSVPVEESPQHYDFQSDLL